jgi:hypothetical protein
VSRFSKIGFVVGALLITTLLKVFFNALGDNGVSWDDPQSSVESSQRKGVYVCRMQANPERFFWNGTVISFQEIWIERRVHTEHPLVWLRRIIPSGGDYLCFTIIPLHFCKGPQSPFFICDEGDFGGGVGWVNDGMLFDSWLKPEAFGAHRAKLRLVQGWNDPDPARVTLTW